MSSDARLTLSSTVGADWQQLQAELARISVTDANPAWRHNSVGAFSVAALLMGGAYISSPHLVFGGRPLEFLWI